MSVKFQLVKARGWTSDLIAYFGGAALKGFSHVDIVMPDGRLLGARSDRIGGQPEGIWSRPQGYDPKWTRRVVFELPATPAQESSLISLAKSSIGTPYNEVGIIGFALGKDWTEASAMFCSQFAAKLLESAALCEKLYFPESEVTPDCFAFLLSALGAVVIEHEEDGVLIPTAT